MIKKRKNNIVILVICLLITSQISAQTFVWEMKPRSYSELYRITKELYLVVDQGKKGIIRPDGTPVVDAICSEITSFYENRALLLKRENDRDQVIGVLTESGECYIFDNTYYVLSGQRFYSEGLLTVENNVGEKGYIDERGREILGFNKSHYDNIKPFTEGYAAISQDQKYTLIDKAGNKMRIIIGIGEIRGGTNVYNNEAYVWDIDGKYYIYNTKMRKCKKAQRPNSMQIDYLYRLSELTKCDEKVPYQAIVPDTLGIYPIQKDGKFGYELYDHVILPAQFPKASRVEYGYAIVCINDQYGILKYYKDSEGFSLINQIESYEYLKGQSVNCKFSVKEPGVWQNQQFDVVVKDANNKANITVDKQGQDYSFEYLPEDDVHSFVVDILSEGMILQTETLTFTFKKKQIKVKVATDNGSSNKKKRKEEKPINPIKF